MTRMFLTGAAVWLLCVLASWAAADEMSPIRGVVYHDANGSGSFEAGTDQPLPGVAVSNGRDVVVTDPQGRYELPSRVPGAIFVIKPRGWTVPVDELQIPRFYRWNMPQGAGGQQHARLAPSAPLPASVDFPLRPQDEPDQFRVLVFGDTQPRDLAEIQYIARDSVAEVVGFEAAFGVTLGDLVFDDLTLFDAYSEAIAAIGLPWRHVLGNHDLDYTGNTDLDARGTYLGKYGPAYYSFTWGPAHFVVLDTVRWIVAGNQRQYRTGLGEDQFEFLRNELSRVPDDQLVVVLTHIPWVDSTAWTDDAHRQEVFQLLSTRSRIVTLAAHTHRHYHRWIGPEDGWPGQRPPHHLVSVGTVCGAWWTGALDEYGIPHALMSDGTPNGYAILEIDGAQWKLRWQVAQRPATFQMHLDVPDSLSADQVPQTLVLANIFNALPDARVQLRVGRGGVWQPMQRTVQPDPVRQRVMAREQSLGEMPWRPLGAAHPSQHIWQAAIGQPLAPGTHVIEVRAEDDWHTLEGRRLIRVTAAP